MDARKREQLRKENAECILRNGGKINPKNKTVFHRQPGIKVLGAMDCLINHWGYKWSSLTQ